MDGTLIEAWLGRRALRKKGSGEPPEKGPKKPTVNFHGDKRKNGTYQSTTDPQSRLYRKAKGRESKLVYMGHVVMENRHGLVVGCGVTQATGTAEREAAEALLAEIPRSNRATVGGDKGYDTWPSSKRCDDRCNATRCAEHDQSRECHRLPDDALLWLWGERQVIRKAVEHPFGWIKTVGNLRKTRHRGRRSVGWIFTRGWLPTTLSGYGI